MNAYCRRAVSKGVELAKASGGTCTVFTLGPPSAEDVLREAVAWGADKGVHLCDSAFSGSDTLATARSLAGALKLEGDFDLILVGRNSLDGDTGQVGPEIAQLCGLPFAAGVRRMWIEGDSVSLHLEHDDGWQEAEVTLPVLLSVAERLCEPCKVPPPLRAEVNKDRIRIVTADALGAGPWGQEGSPTRVGQTRLMQHNRLGTVLNGTYGHQVLTAVSLLAERGALTRNAPEVQTDSRHNRERLRSQSRVIAVLIEPDRPQVGAEILGTASHLARSIDAQVHALAFEDSDVDDLGAAGADIVTTFTGNPAPEDVATATVEWSTHHPMWALIGPSTAFGREVLGRTAASLGAGLVGDAIGLEIVNGALIAAKPAFSGALLADITCTSDVRIVSIRPGVLPLMTNRPCLPIHHSLAIPPIGKLRLIASHRDDDIEVLARATSVIGVGAGVQPGEYADLSELAAVLGAELAATRKVTDNGWAPRSRQVGITGRSIAPSLYIALGLSGKFNHMVGVRGAKTILAINKDSTAPVFSQCDIGIVGDWHIVVPALASALRGLQNLISKSS